jgi:hypothetical protein
MARRRRHNRRRRAINLKGLKMNPIRVNLQGAYDPAIGKFRPIRWSADYEALRLKNKKGGEYRRRKAGGATKHGSQRIPALRSHGMGSVGGRRKKTGKRRAAGRGTKRRRARGSRK